MKRFRGFTLVELMITIAVLAILVTLTAPSFSNIIKNNRLTTQSNALVASLAMARSESAKRKSSVSVCASSNQSTCSGDTDWKNGWIVFVDIENNFTGNGAFNDSTPLTFCTVDANNRPTEDCLLSTQEKLSGKPTFPNSSGVSSISYEPLGSTNNSPTFSLKPDGCTGNEARAIIISPTGRPYADKDPVAC